MKKYLLLLVLFVIFTNKINAQNDGPEINPSSSYVDGNKEEKETLEMSGSAPIIGTFRANPFNNEGWEGKYEWRFTRESETEPYLIRYDENTEVEFRDAGSVKIVCYATFTKDGETVYRGEEYWKEKDFKMSCSVSTSKLEMPNAFSPNGDQRNDYYRPKKTGVQSIVEFRAIIFNRHGQKLYEWTDPNGQGWDGTYNGHPVKEGVYYCLVKALGSDGIKYNYKKDVNLLRGFNETAQGSEE